MMAMTSFCLTMAASVARRFRQMRLTEDLTEMGRGDGKGGFVSVWGPRGRGGSPGGWGERHGAVGSPVAEKCDVSGIVGILTINCFVSNGRSD